jgi:hypothetical protein
MSHQLVGHGAAGIAGLIKQAGQTCSHREPEYGTIFAGPSLEPDSMPGMRIPAHSDVPGGFRVLRGWEALALDTTAVSVGDHGPHSHQTPDLAQSELNPLLEGDRVVLIWMGASPLILGRI